MAPYLFRWKSRPDIARLEQDNDRLRIELIKLRRDLQTRQTQVGGLKLALAPCHCVQHSFLLCISCNGKQFHASQIRPANEIDVETKAR